MSSLLNLESKSLDARALKRLVPGVQIWAYEDLPNTVEELLGPAGCAIILYVTDREPGTESGHWVAAWSAPDGLHFQDSYGLTPDAELAWVPKDKRIEWGEDEPKLLRLLRGAGVPLHISRLKEQTWRKGDNTCGYHAACRISHREMSDEEYNTWLNRTRGINPDGAVVLWSLHPHSK